MEFTVTFELEPSAMFGLPQEGNVVLPVNPDGSPRNIVTGGYHAASGVMASWGTLSNYRPDDAKISETFVVGDAAIEADDNFLRVHISASGHGEALSSAGAIVDRLTEQLSLHAGRSVVGKPILIESEDGDAVPTFTVMFKSQNTLYNLDELRDWFQLAASEANVDDERLVSASRYLQHAFWLVDQRGGVTDPYDTNAAMLISSIFLNLWKAASVIVGDPSKDKDYQKRHRALGLTDDFYNEKIMPLRRLRDDSDVAHYSLRNADLEKLKETIGAAIDVVREVIVAHSRAIQRPEGTPN